MDATEYKTFFFSQNFKRRSALIVRMSAQVSTDLQILLQNASTFTVPNLSNKEKVNDVQFGNCLGNPFRSVCLIERYIGYASSPLNYSGENNGMNSDY